MGHGPRLNRRHFLEAAAAVGLGAGIEACGGEHELPPGAPPVPPGTVAVVSGSDDLEAAVRRALDLTGALREIRRGDSVFIKPNAVHPAAVEPGIVTSPAVLAAVIRAVRDQGAGTVIVGDRSARGFESDAVFRATGLGQAALDAGADEVYAAPRPALVPEDWVLLQPERWEEWWSEVGGLLGMRRALEADHLINVPVCKNHRWAVFSIALKAFIGLVGDETRGQMHFVASDPSDLARAIAIMGQIREPLVNVVDATTALVNGGPEGILQDAVRTSPGLVLASRDRIAVDVVGAALLRHELGRVTVDRPDAMHERLSRAGPWSHAQIVHGIERGLGITGPEQLVLRFDGVDVGFEEALSALALG